MPSKHSLKTFQLTWNQVAKAGSDGKKSLSFSDRNDLVALYCSGFVDESKHTVHDWVAAFKGHLQPDGASYLLTEEEWMNKVRFHYDGPVGKPFNPLILREGEWSEANVESLIKHHILPAVYFNENEFRTVWDEAKPQFFVNGKYVVTKKFKEDLSQLVEAYPSPAQVRAWGVEDVRNQMAVKGSGFASGPARSQVATQRLTELISKR